MSAHLPEESGSESRFPSEADLIEAAAGGNQEALADLLEHYRPRLLRMIELRMDARLRRRVDAGDILQDAFVDAAARLSAYCSDASVDVYIWLRGLVRDRLIDQYRHHVGAQKRSAGRELSGMLMQTESSSLAIAEALAQQMTSPSGAVARVELRNSVQAAVAGLDHADREILLLRNYEQLSLDQAAQSLGISKSGANKRHLRALRALKKRLQETTDLEL